LYKNLINVDGISPFIFGESLTKEFRWWKFSEKGSKARCNWHLYRF